MPAASANPVKASPQPGKRRLVVGSKPAFEHMSDDIGGPSFGESNHQFSRAVELSQHAAEHVAGLVCSLTDPGRDGHALRSLIARRLASPSIAAAPAYSSITTGSYGVDDRDLEPGARDDQLGIIAHTRYGPRPLRRYQLTAFG